MPKGENFWNPYRWVPTRSEAPELRAPTYHHQLSGWAGRLSCEIEALTPLVVGDGNGRFVKQAGSGRPLIPGTSLKGAIRSLAELIGNAAVPFDRGELVDEQHRNTHASQGTGRHWQLDVASRIFGYMGKGSRAQCFRGLAHFSDALLVGNTQGLMAAWRPVEVDAGQPDPGHRAFYPDRTARKLYHHRVQADSLRPAHTKQKTGVTPAPAGTRFAFTVDFVNLRREELSLLLYCLVLEEQVTVTLSKAALEPVMDSPVTLTGPLRHKLGGCKPHGAGSVHLTLTQMRLCTDSAARYRSRHEAEKATRLLTGEELKQEIAALVEPYVSDSSPTMQQLRAMLIYCTNDPRATALDYPTYDWFKSPHQPNHNRPLKPTL